jgi:hypothetical protein
MTTQTVWALTHSGLCVPVVPAALFLCGTSQGVVAQTAMQSFECFATPGLLMCNPGAPVPVTEWQSI